jgi:3-deoxy-D-manno-octulosonate 8-phosphate phosphatase KdsC-like HAD superfamily phosphatase
VRARADLVLGRPGGHGAVREFVEEVLRKNDAARASAVRPH